MAKQIIKITESDLHNIIRKTVNRALMSEGWKETYDKWSKGDYKDNDEGDKLNRQWSKELKAEHPNPSKRRSEFKKHSDSKTTPAAKKFEKDWKASGGEERFNKDYEKKYKKKVDSDSEVDEAIRRVVRNVIKEAFEDDFNAARDQYLSRKSPNGMFGFEMKNSDGDWQYGDVTFDPNTNTMSCMGVSIEVDPSLSIDQNLEGLYEELINNGYNDGDDDVDDNAEWAEQRIDTEANMDDYPADIH